MEEAKKLEKHVFLFGRQLVPTGKLAPAFHFQGVQPIPDVGLEPVGRRVKLGKGRAGGAGLAATPEGVPRPALLARQELLLLPPGVSVLIPISIDEVDQPGSDMLTGWNPADQETPRVGTPRTKKNSRSILIEILVATITPGPDRGGGPGVSL